MRVICAGQLAGILDSFDDQLRLADVKLIRREYRSGDMGHLHGARLSPFAAVWVLLLWESGASSIAVHASK